jgi:hypothetical protein
VAVVSNLLDAKDLEGPSLCAVAPLEGPPKLINVDELASWEFKDPESERRGAIPEGINPKLNLLIHLLIGLDGGLLLGELELIKILGDALL